MVRLVMPLGIVNLFILARHEYNYRYLASPTFSQPSNWPKLRFELNSPSAKAKIATVPPLSRFVGINPRKTLKDAENL